MFSNLTQPHRKYTFKYKQFKLLASKQFKSLVSQFSNLWVTEKKK